jgi:hypothetical protein
MSVAAAGSLHADHEKQLEPTLGCLREIADALEQAEGAGDDRDSRDLGCVQQAGLAQRQCVLVFRTRSSQHCDA